MMGKRLMSLALVLVLVVSILPGTAGAAQRENPGILQQAVKLAETVRDPLFGTYVVWEINGERYDSRYKDPEYNLEAFNRLDHSDKRKVTSTFATYKKDRDKIFGEAGSQALVDFYNRDTNMDQASRRLQRKLSSIKYPMLTQFYHGMNYPSLPPEVAQMCRSDAICAQREQERQDWYYMGYQAYQSLTRRRNNIVQQQILDGQGIILDLVVDNFFVPAVTPKAIAGHSTEIILGLHDAVENGWKAAQTIYERNTVNREKFQVSKNLADIEAVIRCDLEVALICRDKSIAAYDDLVNTYNSQERKDQQEKADQALLLTYDEAYQVLKASKEEEVASRELIFHEMPEEDRSIQERRDEEYRLRREAIEQDFAALKAEGERITRIPEEPIDFKLVVYPYNDPNYSVTLNLLELPCPVDMVLDGKLWPLRREIRRAIVQARNAVQVNWDVCETKKALYRNLLPQLIDLAERRHEELYYFRSLNLSISPEACGSEENQESSNFTQLVSEYTKSIQESISSCDHRITGRYYNPPVGPYPSKVQANPDSVEKSYQHICATLDTVLENYDKNVQEAEQAARDYAGKWNRRVQEGEELERESVAVLRELEGAIWGLATPEQIKKERRTDPDAAMRHALEWFSIRDYVSEQTHHLQVLYDKQSENGSPSVGEAGETVAAHMDLLRKPRDRNSYTSSWYLTYDRLIEEYQGATSPYDDGFWQRMKWDQAIGQVRENLPLLLRADEPTWLSYKSKLDAVAYGSEENVQEKWDEYHNLVDWIVEMRKGGYEEALALEGGPAGEPRLQSGGTNLPVGGSLQFTAKVSPANATFTQVFWESSDPTVASVDETGLVTGWRDGPAVITARAADTKVLENGEMFPAPLAFPITVGAGVPVRPAPAAGVQLHNYGTAEVPLYVNTELSTDFLAASVGIASCPVGKQIVMELQTSDGTILATRQLEIDTETFSPDEEDNLAALQVVPLPLESALPPDCGSLKLVVRLYTLSTGEGAPVCEGELLQTVIAVPEPAQTYTLTILDGDAEGAQLFSVPKQYQVKEGASFTVRTIVPEGKELVSWEVEQGTPRELPRQNRFRFIMPGENVTLRAVYGPHTHAFSPWVRYNANLHTRSCACHEIQYEAHTFGDWVTAEDGSRRRTCTVCGSQQWQSGEYPITAERDGDFLILRWEKPALENLDHYELTDGSDLLGTLPADTVEYRYKATYYFQKCCLLAVTADGTEHPFQSFRVGDPDATGLTLFTTQVNPYSAPGTLEVLVTNNRKYATAVTMVLAGYDASGRMVSADTVTETLEEKGTADLKIASKDAVQGKVFVLSAVTGKPLRQTEAIDLR